MSTAAMPAVPPAAHLDPRGPMPPSLSPTRQYQQPQSHQPPSTREGGHVTARATSPRRSPGRPSRGTNSGHASNSSPQRSSRAPNGSTPASSHPTTPRAQQIPLTQNSPMIPTAAVPSAISYETSNQPEHGWGPPIPPPPRTSSNQQGQQAALSASVPTGTSTGEARSVGDNRPSPVRAAQAGDGRERGDRERGVVTGQATGNERERAKDDTASAAAVAARSRRRGHREPREEEPQRSSSTRESRAREPEHAVQSRSSATIDATGETDISREGSRVINRYIVTDPVVDLERERERLAEARPMKPGADVTPITGLGLVGSEGVDDGGRGGGRSRQDQSASHGRRKDNKLGEYFLGQTIGEGEFGKVKMGWKQEGGVQVAIKLIRKEAVNTNPTRLPKIYREINILRDLQHPNIVRLHEMVETDRHIGLILEYASGGELFDYILTHRYLRDPSARRLFAQLVSGVGYLHKKGIVHRDLKLENLLLDRNRNIIITDFGFANTFDPTDELGDEIEYNLSNKDFVKRMDLERIRSNGLRRGDLMATSCGSPCYAAPELVVSDGLYTGRKVDVWSCGVILYAMLAGYLPFDDDPDNPEGDNINLLYKYIVTTPLTFPDYVTPHARDLLRRILVADPVKRADLFEVARHSWLSEYAHVVSFITSSTTTTGEIANTTVTSDPQDTPLLARSASVREPSKSHQPHLAAVGGLSHNNDDADPENQSPPSRPHRDAKRRTVQVEYVAPSSETSRADPQVAGSSVEVVPASSTNARVRPGDQGPAEVVPGSRYPIPSGQAAAERHQGSVGPNLQVFSGQARTQQRPSTSSQVLAGGMGPPARSARDGPRSVSDSIGVFAAGSSIPRPNTGGSLTSTGSRSGLPSRGSYTLPGQPAAPTVATTNAHGKLAQPKNGKHYVISNPIPQQQDDYGARPSSYGRMYATAAEPNVEENTSTSRSHKRSNTIGGIGEKLFGRSGSLFGGKSQTGQDQGGRRPSKAHPPTSMSAPNAANNPRRSTDSRRSTSFGFGRKGSKSSSGLQEKPKRFSFLPAAFSFKTIGGGSSSAKDIRPPGTSQSMTEPRELAQPGQSRPKQKRPEMAFGRGMSQSTAGNTTEEKLLGLDGPHVETKQQQAVQLRGSTANAPWRTQADQGYVSNQRATTATRSGQDVPLNTTGVSRSGSGSESSLPAAQPPGPYPTAFNAEDDEKRRRHDSSSGRGPAVLHKSNRKFVEAYEAEPERERRYAHGGHNSGSSGAARKVMDFFRRRGKAKAWDER